MCPYNGGHSHWLEEVFFFFFFKKALWTERKFTSNLSGAKGGKGVIKIKMSQASVQSKYSFIYSVSFSAHWLVILLVGSGWKKRGLASWQKCKLFKLWRSTEPDTLCMFVLQAVGVKWTMTTLLRVGDGIQLLLSDRHVDPMLTGGHVHPCGLRTVVTKSVFHLDGKAKVVVSIPATLRWCFRNPWTAHWICFAWIMWTFMKSHRERKSSLKPISLNQRGAAWYKRFLPQHTQYVTQRGC